MSEKKLLKNCPFCGGEALLIEGLDFEGDTCHWVECKKCFVKGFGVPNREMAIRRWNARKPMEKIVERLEEEDQEQVDMANMTMDIYIDGQVSGLERAIEIVKEEGGLNG